MSIQCQPNCSMRTDGHTDMTKLTIACRNFANAPNDTVRDRTRRLLRLHAVSTHLKTHSHARNVVQAVALFIANKIHYHGHKPELIYSSYICAYQPYVSLSQVRPIDTRAPLSSVDWITQLVRFEGDHREHLDCA